MPCARKIRLPWTVATLVLFVVVALSSRADSPRDDFATLKNMVETSTADDLGTIRRFMVDLEHADLLQLAKQAASADEGPALRQLANLELIKRVKSGKIAATSILDAVAGSDDAPAYQADLLWGFLATCRSLPASANRDVLRGARTQIGSGGKAADTVRLAAVAACNSVAARLHSGQEAEPGTIASLGRQLLDLATDDREDSQIRRAAIKGLPMIDHRGAIPDLLSLAAQGAADLPPPVAKSVCLSLARFRVTEAVAPIGDILRETDDELVFAAAAMALGDLGGRDAFATLVDASDRFGGTHTGTALRKIYPQVLDHLATGDRDDVARAIKASTFFYRGQRIANLKQALLDLLDTNPEPWITGLVMQRLQQLVDKEEAGRIASRVAYDEAYGDQWLWLDRYARSISLPLPPGSGDDGTPTHDDGADKNDSYRGNKNHQEYGDAVYRHLTSLHQYNKIGHAGLFAGRDTTGILRTLEIETADNHAVKDSLLSDLIWTDGPYWGAYGVPTHNMRFEDRRNLIATAEELRGRDIGYPFGAFSMIDFGSTGNDTIDEDEIINLRCDGLVEYCYERNGIMVWGKNGTDTHRDVTVPANADEHNVVFVPDFDPDVGTAPAVQCTEDWKGGTSSYLGSQSFCRPPGYFTVDYYYDCEQTSGTFTVDLWITARDKSGIFFIDWADTNEVEYATMIFDSDQQPRHPTSEALTAHWQYTTDSSHAVWYRASDNGGNTNSRVRSYVELICPAIEITYPANGEALPVGSRQEITWNTQGLVGDIEIEYSVDAGSNWQRVVSQALNDGYFEWIVPDEDPSSTCQLRIVDIDGSPGDTTGTYFTITGDPDLTLVFPDGGEVIEGGSISSIDWLLHAPAPTDNLLIEYSIDEGESWDEVLASTPIAPLNSPWPVPDTPSERCLVRIRHLGTTHWEISDAVFTITPEPFIEVGKPNGGEILHAGKTTFIEWSTSEGVGNVHLDYRISDGAAWVPIAGVTDNDGVYQWEIWDTPSEECLIRICEADGSSCLGGGLSDVSDGHFTILEGRSYTVVTPQRNDVYLADTDTVITWTSAGDADTVAIWFSTDGGDEWTLVVSQVPNDGAYTWTVPHVASMHCLLLIEDNESFNEGRSDTFRISNPSGVPAEPLRDRLISPYPNPFNPQVKIAYTLGSAGPVDLAVYDLKGRRVATLVSREETAGRHAVTWDGRSDGGGAASSGTYFVRLKTTGMTESIKISLVR